MENDEKLTIAWWVNTERRSESFRTTRFVTSDHYMYDSDSGRVVSYTNMAEAKQACETMGSVCLGEVR
jgi:hypothetical protein